MDDMHTTLPAAAVWIVRCRPQGARTESVLRRDGVVWTFPTQADAEAICTKYRSLSCHYWPDAVDADTVR